MANLVNGAGSVVTPQMDADFFMSIFGMQRLILNVGKKMQAEIVDNNTVRVLDGEMISNGRLIYIKANTYDTFKLETGAQGVTRYDVIGYRIYKSAGQELCETFVRKNVGKDATIKEELLRDGAEEAYISLYKIKISGISIAEIVPLCDAVHEGMQRKITCGDSEPDTGIEGDLHILQRSKGKGVCERFEDGKWQEQYLKTSADQVSHSKKDGSSTTVEQMLLDLEKSKIKALWTGTAWNGSTLTLKESIENYNWIILWVKATDSAKMYCIPILSLILQDTNSSAYLTHTLDETGTVSIFKTDADNTMRLWASGSVSLVAVYGC